MKKKGFTLIELLAVIVILAIIAVIATPTILGVIEKSKKGSAKSSALGYIDAVEMKTSTGELDGIVYEDKENYSFDEIKVSVKGNIPTSGSYSLRKNKVISAAFCINGYVVEYNGIKAEVKEKCTGEDLKLPGRIKLSKNTTNISYTNTEEIEIVENVSGGNVTCGTSDSSVATCTVEGNKIKVTSGKTEGSATLTIKSEGNSKYREAQAALVVVTTKGLMSVTANGYTGIYDGEGHGITVEASGATIKYGEEEGTYNLESSPTYRDVGEYTVYYEVTKEGYKTARGNKTVIISKANGSVTAPTAKTLNYTGEAQALVNGGSSTTGEIQYKLEGGSYSTSIPTGTSAGTYKVYYKVVGDKNHKDVEEQSIISKIIEPKYTVYSNGTAVYYNPTTGEKCTESESVSTTGTKSGCMKWYTYNDSGSSSTVNIILDHNTTAKVAYNSSNSNASMKEAKTALENDTSTWKETARLITADEIAKITGNTTFKGATTSSSGWFYLDSNNQTQTATSQGASKYAWLYDYIYGCTSYGCNKADNNSNIYGYWTSTPVYDHGSHVWFVSGRGFLNVTIANLTNLGVRPVITISKDIIK